jgi:DNA replication protein DnaC
MQCSNLPVKYRDVTFDKFVNQDHPSYRKVTYYAQNIRTARLKGTGMHLYSTGAGTGKTLLASCVLQEAAKAGNWVWFISMTRLLEEIKAGYDSADKKAIIEWAMYRADFLFLDEIEKFHPSSEWVKDRINDLIQERVNRQLPILSSGNDSLEALSRIYQGHLISRFIGTQIEILIDSSVDYRKDVLKEQLYAGLEPQDIL